MRKLILLATFILGLNTITKAQVSVSEENDVKNFRFGLKGSLSLDWMKVDNDKKFQPGGVGLGYDWGLQLEFRLNKTLSFVSGLSLITNNMKINYTGATSADTVLFMLNKDEEFLAFGGDTSSVFSTMLNANNNVYWLKNRSIRANYVNIPIALKMKTKEIGYLTYFGQFGANIGIRTGAKTNDDVQKLSFNTDTLETANFYGSNTTINGESITLEKLDVTSGVQAVRVGLKIGGGAEYNFSGTTSAYFEINYNQYFTNALRKESKETNLNALDYVDKAFQNVGAKATMGSVSLTVGILF
ncbi:MAG: outer membrane beta-barrel protein [Flavobacteriales bacterium]|nr:outer membrane beta-barrel protein [Flavobacteriales bacterium]MCB9196871.1 outer membrane beta-barrel protein [Flavobacteriales bacterium]